MSTEIKSHTFVSELEKESSLFSDDLILASKAIDGIGYKSVHISYGDLSNQLTLETDQKIANLVEEALSELSTTVNQNTIDISALSVQEEKCESAIVKIANCLQQTMTTTQSLVDSVRTFQEAVDISVDVAFVDISSEVKSITDQLTAFDDLYDRIDGFNEGISSISDIVSAAQELQSTQITEISDYVSASINAISGSTISYIDSINSSILLTLSGLSSDLCSSIAISADALSGRMVVISGDTTSIDRIVGSPLNNQIVIIGNRQYIRYKNNWIELGNKSLRESVETSCSHWNGVVTVANRLSSIWNYAADKLDTSADYWNSVYTQVSSQSADWNTAVSRVRYLSTLSANWESVYVTTRNLSNDCRNAHLTVSQLSNGWEYNVSTVNNLSNSWQGVVQVINSISADLSSSYNTVSSLSNTWNGVLCSDGSFVSSDYPDGTLIFVRD